MAGNYVEDKYRCNHPESDFVSNSKGPIEIKQDRNFVEYTHRNETANYRYDVWKRPSTSATFNNSTVSNSTVNNPTVNNSTNSYSTYNKSTYSNTNTTGTSYNRSSSQKKSNGSIIWILIIIYVVLPIVFSIFGFIGEIFDMIF